jgi:hypothetical protein
MSANHLLTSVVRICNAALRCISPRRYWQLLRTERAHDHFACWVIIILLASLRVLSPLSDHAHQFFFSDSSPNNEALSSNTLRVALYAILIPVGALCTALIARFLAPLFQGTTSWLDAFKLVTYSSPPVLVASGCGLLSAQPISSIWFWLCHALVWGWSIALLYEGIRVLTTVIPTQRLSYFTSVVTSILLLYLTLGLLGFFVARIAS